MKRKPAVAGQFYQEDPDSLDRQVRQYVTDNLSKEQPVGIVSPHAGLIYSGPVAGKVYSSIEMPETFVLIGPNHTGLGASVSIMSQGEWEMPDGPFQIDEKLSRRILTNAPLAQNDTQAHLLEHSLEVQLPFISYFSKEAKTKHKPKPKPQIVPIIIMSATLEDCRLLGEGISKAIKSSDYTIVIVASSDMSHYVSDDIAREKDKMALDKILSLDPEGLYNTVRKERISMCGYLPATIMLYAAKALGAKEARLVKYTTSAEVSRDYEHVVGYAGIIIR